MEDLLRKSPMRIPSWLPPWIKKKLNPHNQTRVHLAGLIAKYGFDIGEYSYGAPKVRFPGMGASLKIGRYCSIADRVDILLGGNHRTDFVTTYPFTALPGLWPEAEGMQGYAATRGDVVIGSDVWLGSGATIMSGVTIGHGAVIAARAVITKDVPPYAVIGGNPAKLIRYRFSPEVIERLLATAWWNLPEPTVRKLIPLLQSGNIDAALATLETEESWEAEKS